MNHIYITALAAVLVVNAGAVTAQEVLTRDQLAATDVAQGRGAFLERCGACHTLIEGGGDLMGPNLANMFGRHVAVKESFAFSQALSAETFEWTPDKLLEWIADPENFVPGNRMLIPEAVPEADRAALIAYIMVKTGAADWEVPDEEISITRLSDDRPLWERYPSFWEHLMENTGTFRLVTDEETFRYRIYYNKDGTVTSNREGMRGFWREQRIEGEPARMCYALMGLPMEPYNVVECFPIIANSIPRYGEALWASELQTGITLEGGMLSGRPHPDPDMDPVALNR